jgi:hypothetical protein
MDDRIVNQVLENLQALPDNLQRRVLNFARFLRLSEPHGVAGKDLLQFAGTIPAADLRLISQAIEDGCEQVDSNEW